MADPSTRFDAGFVRILVIMVLGGMMAFLDATIVNVGVDTIRGEFGIGLDGIHWIATGYLLAVAVATPLAGWLVDRYGGKRMWLTALAVFVAGSVACSLAQSAGALVAFRVLQGLGGGLVEPIMLALLVRAAGPARVPRLMGVLGAITVGPVLGPVLGGIVLANFSWHWLFLINVPIGVAAFALAARWLPADSAPDSVGARVDLRGIALLCPGAAALMYGLTRGGEAGFGSPGVLVPAVAGFALVALYLVHALRTSGAPLIDPRLFAHRAFAASALGMTALGIILFGLLFLVPLYYQRVHGHGLLAVGLLMAPLGLGALIGNPVAARLAVRFGPRGLAPVGAALVALAALVFAVASTATPAAWLAAVSFAAGFGVGCIGAPTMGALYRTVPDAAVPRATSATLVLNQLGAAGGIAVIALVLTQRTRDLPPEAAFSGTFWWLFGVAALVAVAGLALPGPAAAPVPADGPAGSDAPAR